MKKIITVAAAVAALLLTAACNKDVQETDLTGYLSFAELYFDDEVITKATSAASGNYSIFIYDSASDLVLSTTYTAVKNNDNLISLSAGDYTLVARSTEEEVPTA